MKNPQSKTSKDTISKSKDKTVPESQAIQQRKILRNLIKTLQINYQKYLHAEQKITASEELLPLLPKRRVK